MWTHQIMRRSLSVDIEMGVTPKKKRLKTRRPEEG